MDVLFLKGTEATKENLAAVIQRDAVRLQTILEQFGVNNPTKFGVTVTKQENNTLILFTVSE